MVFPRGHRRISAESSVPDRLPQRAKPANAVQSRVAAGTGLRWGSQGFALMLITPLFGVALYKGYYGGVPTFADILARPADYWPLLVGAGLVVVGAVRVYAGAPMVLGARDSAEWFKGVLRFALGIAAIAFVVGAIRRFRSPRASSTALGLGSPNRLRVAGAPPGTCVAVARYPAIRCGVGNRGAACVRAMC
jgi:hypothetical protein